jgi:hypothetical protein
MVLTGGARLDKRVVLVAFNGESMCFVHVLLNGLDMKKRGYDVKIVVEGTATKLVNDLNDEAKPFGKLYLKVRDAGLIDCVCEACAAKMEALDGVKAQGLPLGNDMNGHPSLARYMDQGYQIITF